MHESTETEQKPNGKSRGKRKAKKSPQIQVPGTEHNASQRLRDMHDDFAQAKYDRHGAGETMKTLKPAIVEALKAEGLALTGISSEVEYGGERRLVVTRVEPGKEKLVTEMQKIENAPGDE